MLLIISIKEPINMSNKNILPFTKISVDDLVTIKTNSDLYLSTKNLVNEYLQTVDLKYVTNLHELVIDEMESSLFEAVMIETQGNQSTAAKMLGMSRATLRKKLEKFNMLYCGKV